MCDHPNSSDNPHNPHKCIYTGDARAVVWTPTPPPKVVEEKVYKNKKVTIIKVEMLNLEFIFILQKYN